MRKEAVTKSLFDVDNVISLSLFWINQGEVNHLCFPPSHHLLVVDGVA